MGCACRPVGHAQSCRIPTALLCPACKSSLHGCAPEVTALPRSTLRCRAAGASRLPTTVMTRWLRTAYHTITCSRAWRLHVWCWPLPTFFGSFLFCVGGDFAMGWYMLSLQLLSQSGVRGSRVKIYMCSSTCIARPHGRFDTSRGATATVLPSYCRRRRPVLYLACIGPPAACGRGAFVRNRGWRDDGGGGGLVLGSRLSHRDCLVGCCSCCSQVSACVSAVPAVARRSVPTVPLRLALTFDLTGI